MTIPTPTPSIMSGASLMVLTVIVFVVQDAAVKFLTGGFSVAQIVLLRCVVTLVAVVACAAFAKPYALRTDQLGMHVLRGALLLVSGGTFFFAFRRLPLADAYTIFYMVPLAMTVLASLVLGEQAPKRALAAIALGLIGVGVVVGPQLGGGEILSYAACVAGTFSYALVGVITRKLAARETPLALLFYASLVMTLMTLPVAPFGWTVPGWRDLAIFVVIGLLWPLAHWLFATALQRAPIAQLAPFEYSSIVWVVAIDYFVFAIAPAITTLTGSAIIIVACLLLIERRPRAVAT